LGLARETRQRPTAADQLRPSAFGRRRQALEQQCFSAVSVRLSASVLVRCDVRKKILQAACQRSNIINDVHLFYPPLARPLRRAPASRQPKHTLSPLTAAYKWPPFCLRAPTRRPNKRPLRPRDPRGTIFGPFRPSRAHSLAQWPSQKVSRRDSVSRRQSVKAASQSVKSVRPSRPEMRPSFIHFSPVFSPPLAADKLGPHARPQHADPRGPQPRPPACLPCL